MLFIFVIIHMFSLQVVVGFPLTSRSRGWFHKDLQPGPAPYWAPGHALKLWLHSTHNRRRNKTCGQTVSPLEGLIDSPICWISCIRLSLLFQLSLWGYRSKAWGPSPTIQQTTSGYHWHGSSTIFGDENWHPGFFTTFGRGNKNVGPWGGFAMGNSTLQFSGDSEYLESWTLRFLKTVWSKNLTLEGC